MKIRKIKSEYVLLVLILVFALFLRIYALGNPPLWIDEASSAMASKMILEKGIPVFDSGMSVGRAYVFHYIQSFFLLFGENDFFVRFPSVIFGLLIILLAYFIGREYSKSGGILAALFMSVFYLEVFYSRQARMYQLFQLMFFLSVYLLYRYDKTKNNKLLYLSLIAFFITIDSQIAGLILAPFFIVYILFSNKKYLSILPAIPLVYKFISIWGLKSDSVNSSIGYAKDYFKFAGNIHYLLIFSVPGVIWSYFKNKKLTMFIILPSLALLTGVFLLKLFALRYVYFFVFVLILYSSLLISFLYEKYGKIMLVAIIALLLIPSNLFFPYTGVNIIKPVDYNYNDYSAPFTDYKNLNEDFKLKLKTNIIVSLFSSDVEWYLKKPDYVIAFSMSGIGDDQISYNRTIDKISGKKEVVDRYSGALILTDINEFKAQREDKNEIYYVLEDSFSSSKLKTHQREEFSILIEDCGLAYEEKDLRVWEC